MTEFNYFWIFKEGLPKRICDDIIKYGDLKKEEERLGIIGDIGDRDITKKPLTKKELKKLYELRKSNIVWMEDRWIYQEVHPFIHAANKQAGWNYQWDWSETSQYTIYNKGGYYDWHCDSWPAPYKGEGEQKGKIRKLSVTVCLSDASEFEGGDLEFDYRNVHPKKPKPIIKASDLTKGSIVVFPSWVWHRVTPVTKGIRKSLVVWSCGWPFK